MSQRRFEPPPTRYAPKTAMAKPSPPQQRLPAAPPRPAKPPAAAAPRTPPPPPLRPVMQARPAPAFPQPPARPPGAGARTSAAMPRLAAPPPGRPGAAAVAQPWRNYIPGWVRQGIAVAAGAAAGTAAFIYTPQWSFEGRRNAAIGTGLAAAAITDWALGPTDYAGIFSAQIANQQAFYQDIDQRLNAGAVFTGATNTLDVPGASLQDAANRLRARERQQRNLVGTAYAWGLDIFDATIANHLQKNQLWRRWMTRAGGGQTRTGAAVGRGFRDRVATTLARIIATAPGFTLMQQVDNEATALGIPINFLEENAGAAFNLSVGHTLNPAGNQLVSLDVTLPAGAQYDDAQSFKRSNRRLLGGGHDVTQVGEHLTAAPLDTDLFHEFVHAAHYLAMERRRQNGVGNFVTEVGHYRAQMGGLQDVLVEQDTVAESATIHRSASLMNLHQLMQNNALATPALVPNPHAQGAASVAAIDQIATAANVPAENTYRAAIGLAPRQDHRGVTRNGAGYGYNGWVAPINVT